VLVESKVMRVHELMERDIHKPKVLSEMTDYRTRTWQIRNEFSLRLSSASVISGGLATSTTPILFIKCPTHWRANNDVFNVESFSR
jgi:hypothetical protein